MCVVGPSAACDGYEEDYDWMERSGNLCWGMGAADTIPCRNCGQRYMYHSVRPTYMDYPDAFWLNDDFDLEKWEDEGGNGSNKRASSRED